MGKQEHRPQDETRQLILQIVSTSPRPLTRLQIAQALQRRKTPHLAVLIDEFVAQGVFMRHIITRHNGVQAYAYSLASAP